MAACLVVHGATVMGIRLTHARDSTGVGHQQMTSARSDTKESNENANKASMGNIGSGMA